VKDKQVESLKKALPKNFRIRWCPADLEGPAHIVFHFPDHYLIEIQDGRRCLGLRKRWDVVAFFHQHFPFDAQNVIRLHDRHRDHLSTINEAISVARLDDVIQIEIV
jgi:hypothetical protein